MTDRPTNPTDRPGLRPAAPERASVNGHRPTDRRPTTRTDRPEPTGADRRPADVEPTDPTAKPTSRFRRWREGKATAANAAVAAGKRSTDPTAVAVAAAAHRRPTRPTGTRPTDADIAPVPRQIKWLGVWLDRTFGAMPLIAPLVVSGYFTMQVFTQEPVGVNAFIAFLATCALEGGVWKLARLYEKTLVAGDSTIALRLGIGVYLALISGMIYWHADHQAQVRGQAELGYDALPALGAAAMSALGVFIWSRTARWTRRQELHAQGRVDMQVPKFAVAAWILCPIETPKALRHAVKYRIPGPVEAVADLRLYRSVGRPSVWPPLPTDQTPTEQPTDRPAVEQTRLTPSDRPTAAHRLTEPTVATAPRPTAAPTPAERQTAAPTPARPTDPTPTDRPTFSDAAIRNAAVLRKRYGTRTDLKVGTVRGDTGWSFDRADPAVKAYLAGADRPTNHSDQPTDPTEEPATDGRPLTPAR